MVRFSTVARPNLAPGALQIDGARLAAPVAPKIRPVDHFYGHFVTMLGYSWTSDSALKSGEIHCTFLRPFRALAGTNREPTGSQPGTRPALPGRFPVGSRLVPGLFRVRSGKMDPEVFFWPGVFLEAWGTKTKNHTFSGK